MLGRNRRTSISEPPAGTTEQLAHGRIDRRGLVGHAVAVLADDNRRGAGRVDCRCTLEEGSPELGDLGADDLSVRQVTQRPPSVTLDP